MNLLFVTGSNFGFFNTLLVTLATFAERLPGQRLHVCDYGLGPPQAEFLRRLGLLLERPPTLPAHDVFRCKAALLRYLRHNGHAIERHDAIVWLDGDLTFMDVGIGDFESTVAAMKSARSRVAACAEPAGRSLGQMTAIFADGAMAPFSRTIAAAEVNPALPYFSSGLFFCDSPELLTRWDEMTLAIDHHPLHEQNMFNLALHRDHVSILTLDCEEWQAQGDSLDRIELRASHRDGRAAAFVGDKSIKTLHATSPAQGHLLIAPCRLTVRELELTGTFKLFLAERLRMHQLERVALFVLAHGDALLRLGICARAARPVEGFQFVTLPGT
jgi:hypothetical protein